MNGPKCPGISERGLTVVYIGLLGSLVRMDNQYRLFPRFLLTDAATFAWLDLGAAPGMHPLTADSLNEISINGKLTCPLPHSLNSSPEPTSGRGGRAKLFGP